MTTTISTHTASTRVAPDAVTADGLTKRYGSHTAVDHVSFTVPAGAVAGLIGPNGAGKTTIMAMLLGLVRPTGGTGTVLGAPISRRADYLDRVGALIETPAFHPGVSGSDNLRSLAALSGQNGRDIPELLDLVGLAGRGKDRVGSYSLGMKQRLGIAAALLGRPDLVILDEPTNGLDPVGMQEVRTIVRDIAERGCTVVVSSHLLSELEQVCDWLIVVDHGGLVHLGSPDLLGARTNTLVLRADDVGRLDDLHAIAGSTELPVHVYDGSLYISLPDHVDAHQLAAEINRRAHVAGIILTELHHEWANLEARYLDMVGGAR
jgi:ABC-2 type transport system ATP-binding protein